MDESEILPDVPRILEYLSSQEVPIALGSASKNARTISQGKSISFFNAIVDGTNVSKAKPDPEVFLRAAELLSTKPQDCIVFEDSLAGIQAANMAKMTSIEEINDLSEADFVFQDFTKFLLNLSKN